MNWQIAGVLVALITVFISVVGHAITMAWWAARINTTVERLNDMIAAQKEEFAERDKVISKLWEKHDNLKDRVTVLEASK